MAMQSSGAAKHGVIQSSIALLQERFRQLQREKEMRERRQLLRNNTSNFLSSSDSELGNYHLTINSHYNDHFKLVFSDEAAAMRPPEISPVTHHHPVSLSLWPSESYLDGGRRGEKVPALMGAKEKDYTGLYSSYGCLGLSVNCDDSHASDVDTSLHLGSFLNSSVCCSILQNQEVNERFGIHKYITSSFQVPTSRKMLPNQGRESPAESDSSQETWPTANALMAKRLEKEEGENEVVGQSVIRRVSSSVKISLQDVARGTVDRISDLISRLSKEYLDELKAQLRVILEGNGGSQQREEFLVLQKLVQSRFDLTVENLTRAHRVQLEILVAINTGIQAFLHPSINLSQTSLIEVFLYKRCRNIACQSQLPGDDCSCETCTTRKGFCNFCMCVICNKFDFEVNTCRWIGCDMCSHWTHTDCAIHERHIFMGASRAGLGRPEMLFKCRACNKTSELLGWVKDVFLNCVASWNKEALARELDYVCRIFRGSEDLCGRKLFWKCEDLIEKLKAGCAESMASKAILLFFQELESETSKSPDTEQTGQLLAPQEACSRIADVVNEAVRKMEMVADLKMRMIKKARLAVEACERELEDKAREVAELKLERQMKKQQLEDLEGMTRLKQAEAEMFQLKASEARRDAERLQKIILNKSDKTEDYASTYLKLRLEEAEAEKQFLYNKIKIEESTRASGTSNSNTLWDLGA